MQAFTQSHTVVTQGSPTTMVKNRGTLAVDSAIIIPYRDTLSYLDTSGNLVINPSDGMLYYRVDSVWKTFNYGIDTTKYVLYTDSNTIFITPAQLNDSLSAQIVWGNITGIFNNQIDLRDTLAQRVNLSTDQTVSGEKTFTDTIKLTKYLNSSTEDSVLTTSQAGVVKFKSLSQYIASVKILADSVVYNNSTSGLAADNVKDAIDELASGIGTINSYVDTTIARTVVSGDISAGVVTIPLGATPRSANHIIVWANGVKLSRASISTSTTNVLITNSSLPYNITAGDYIEVAYTK